MRRQSILVATILYKWVPIYSLKKGRWKMKRFNDSKITLLLLAFILALMLTAGSAKADFTFGDPMNLKSIIPVIDVATDGIDCFSYDGLEMYSTTYVGPSVGAGDWNLRVLRRASIDEDWGPPENLGPSINTIYVDADATISADGLTLYFNSNRPGGVVGSAMGSDIYMTTRPTKNAAWGPAVNLGLKVNTSGSEAFPWITADGLELYFSSTRPGGYGSADIYVTRRATVNDPWGTAVNLGPVVNSAYTEGMVSLSPDGLLLVFDDQYVSVVNHRPGGYGGTDVWMSRRPSLSAPWQTPVNLGPRINSPVDDSFPRISPDGRTLYFQSGSSDPTTWVFYQAPIIRLSDFTFGEPVDVKSTIPVLDPLHDGTNCFSSDGLEVYIQSTRPGGYGGYDLWGLKRASTDDDWGPAENLGPAVNGAQDEWEASISTDGLTLYFGSDRAGGYGGNDIYVTKRATKSDSWGQPVNLGPNINSATEEDFPWISPDGLELYFKSRRPGGYGLNDIWVTRRATPNDPWGPLLNLGPIVNSPYHEHYPSLSPDGLILFWSDALVSPFRPGGYGSADMWMARRASLSDPWQASVNLGPVLNSPALDLCPRTSPDGRTLYFWSNRGGSNNIWQAPIMPIVDFNGDRIVDMKDFSKLGQHWGQDEPSVVDVGPMPWGDGRVDIQDIAALVEQWLTGF